VSALVTQVSQGLTRGARFNYRSIASLLLVNAHHRLRVNPRGLLQFCSRGRSGGSSVARGTM